MTFLSSPDTWNEKLREEQIEGGQFGAFLSDPTDKEILNLLFNFAKSVDPYGASDGDYSQAAIAIYELISDAVAGGIQGVYR